jgi:hypothetical protein
MFTISDVRDEVIDAVMYPSPSGDSPIQDSMNIDDDGMVLKLSDGSAAYLTVNSIREPCRYSFSHTRTWCGHPFCRAS